jgi:hypothetical protein
MGPEEVFAPHSPDVERREGQGMPFEELFERCEGEIAEREGEGMRLAAQDRHPEGEGMRLDPEPCRRIPSSRPLRGGFPVSKRSD